MNPRWQIGDVTITSLLAVATVGGRAIIGQIVQDGGAFSLKG